ncbi:hypothetical protein CCR75_000423 [Bremia lactucae]|uniref:Uncharacterized protein n=1 Tax=Bremia lactucae TaxID=4779 RepID=A0A976FJ49_BRELC|nr:hypothetical protein CCR75_000423 [Bremia lactucae]
MLLSKPPTLQVCRLKLKLLARLQTEHHRSPRRLRRLIWHSQQQQQQQLNAFMAQTNAFQRTAAIGAVADASAAAPATEKRRANRQSSKAQETKDLELCIFSTKQYYAQYRDEIWRVKRRASLWALCSPISKGRKWQPSASHMGSSKDNTRERFRDRDFEMKVLIKLFELRDLNSRPDTSRKPDAVAKSATKPPTPGDKKADVPVKPSDQKILVFVL